MALQHEFVFVSKDKGELSFEDFAWRDGDIWYKDGTAIENYIILSDDIVGYLSDFLKWIPTYNPIRKEKMVGLNYFSATKIDKEGADIATELFSSLIAMFSLAPVTIELTGSFGWTEGEDDGEYEKLSFDRDLLCSQLESLVTLLKKVQKEEGYLLHYGV